MTRETCLKNIAAWIPPDDRNWTGNPPKTREEIARRILEIAEKYIQGKHNDEHQLDPAGRAENPGEPVPEMREERADIPGESLPRVSDAISETVEQIH